MVGSLNPVTAAGGRAFHLKLVTSQRLDRIRDDDCAGWREAGDPGRQVGGRPGDIVVGGPQIHRSLTVGRRTGLLFYVGSIVDARVSGEIERRSEQLSVQRSAADKAGDAGCGGLLWPGSTWRRSRRMLASLNIVEIAPVI